MDLRGKSQRHKAIEVAHLAAGVIPAKVNPNSAHVMVQLFIHNYEEPFGLNKGAWITSSIVHGRSPSANVTYPRNEGSEHLRTWVPRAQPLAAGGKSVFLCYVVP